LLELTALLPRPLAVLRNGGTEDVGKRKRRKKEGADWIGEW